MLIGIDARSLQEKAIGARRYLLNLLRYYLQIDKKNEYVLYFSKQMSECLPQGFIKKVITFPLIKYNIAWINFRLPLELLANKIDLFHYTYYGLPFIHPCPYVATVHDIIFEAHPEWFPPQRRMAFRLLTKPALKSAKTIIAVSEFTKMDIVKHYGIKEDRIEVVYEAPTEMFRKIAGGDRPGFLQDKYNIKGKYILHVGAIHARRNIKRLLEAFKKIKSKNLDLRLVLVAADIWPGSDLKTMISGLNLSKDVICLGFVPEEDLLHLYNAAEMLVYPSLYEGFGLPLVEAMACGTPIVASNVTSIPEIVGNAGILFDPNNIDEMADSIALVLNDRRLKMELSAKSLERAKKFSWGKAAEATIKVYNEAMR